MSALLQVTPVRFTVAKTVRPAAWPDKNSSKSSNPWPTRLSEILALIEDLKEDCGVENWDCEGALPATEKSLYQCQWALHLLKDEIDLPNLWCEAIGRVNAYWEKGNSNVNIAFSDDRGLLLVGVDTNGKNYIKRPADWNTAQNLLETILN